MKKKVCCIFNLAPHYREPIFRQMDKELDCDFYFGDKVETKIKLMDYESLEGFKKILKNIKIPNTGFEWQKGAWKLIFKPYKYYIITGSPGSLSNWVLLLFALIFGKKVYAWTHGLRDETSTASKYIATNFYRLCNKLLLYGEFSKGLMVKKGFKKSKLIPIYNSLDYSNQIKIRATLKKNALYKNHFKNESPVLLYIGRIQKTKKIDLLIKAIAELKEANIFFNLVLIGSDVENNDIPKLVDNYNLKENVWFYGPCYNESEIGNLLYNADLCVSPGPIGLTALHAATYGLPIVTNDNFHKQMPEFEVIKKGVTGDFFKENDLDDLKQKISYWASLDLDSRNIVQKEAIKIIDDKYNPEYQIQILKELIKN